VYAEPYELQVPEPPVFVPLQISPKVRPLVLQLLLWRPCRVIRKAERELNPIFVLQFADLASY
jgi:hypothetical protein